MIVIANPRRTRPCGHARSISKVHDWIPWRVEGWAHIDLCRHCGRTNRRNTRPKGVKECLLCKTPLTGRKRDWCGNDTCWRRYCAYGNPNGWREYIQWRDKWTCQRCGQFYPNVGIEAHHPHPVAKGGVECDPDNGEILCVYCHEEVHGKKTRVP